MIRQPPRSPLFPSTTLFRPLERELERRALLGQRLEVHARVADRRHAGLADRALVPAGERAADGLVEHGLAADSLEHDLRGDLALAEPGDLEVVAERLRGRLQLALEVLGRDLDVDPHARVLELARARG